MRELIITVAGTATRFNRDTDKDTLKCLYHIGSHVNSLLYQILKKAEGVDRFIIVGGYLYSELETFVEMNLSEYRNKIELVYNPYYKKYGSGYSLIKGIESVSENTDEVLFVEGDLYFDSPSFLKVINSSKNVITMNREFILSDKTVALYVSNEDRVRYVYDTNHNSLVIGEPFKAIYNSAQIWKFTSYTKLKSVVGALTEKQVKGTNLEIIQDYFGNMSLDELEFIPFEIWYNCNTVSDYKKVYSIIGA